MVKYVRIEKDPATINAGTHFQYFLDFWWIVLQGSMSRFLEGLWKEYIRTMEGWDAYKRNMEWC